MISICFDLRSSWPFSLMLNIFNSALSTAYLIASTMWVDGHERFVCPDEAYSSRGRIQDAICYPGRHLLLRPSTREKPGSVIRVAMPFLLRLSVYICADLKLYMLLVCFLTVGSVIYTEIYQVYRLFIPGEPRHESTCENVVLHVDKTEPWKNNGKP